MRGQVAAWSGRARIFCGTQTPLPVRVERVTEVDEQRLRRENIRLRQEAHNYRSLHARSVARIQELEGMVSALKEKVAELTRRLFGRKSEKMGPDQAAQTEAGPKNKRPRGQAQGRPGHGRRAHPQLAEQWEVVKWPGEEPVCGQCGRPYRHNGTVRSHQEIVWEVRLYKRVIRRQRYEQACSCPQPGPAKRLTAPAPVRLIERGLLSMESLVEGLLRKFDSWMPLERIVREWRELGVSISPGTWCGVWQRLLPLFQPLVEALRQAARGAGQWLMDETRWEVFVEVEGKGSHRWWLWVVVSPGVKLYILSPSRGAEVPREFFGYDAPTGPLQSPGSLVVDRYLSYKFLAGLLRLAFCWAHVRRDFVEAQAGAGAEQVSWAQAWIERIGQLYAQNEKRLELGRDEKGTALPAPFVRLDPERMARADYQQAQQGLEQALGAMHQEWEQQLAEPSLPVRRRKILESLREHWPGLTHFVHYPEIPMDNNGSERTIRAAVIGRNNFYGSGSIWSGQLLAAMLTILQTGRLHGVNLRAYLIAYLQACAANRGQAPQDLEPWLPWNYRPQEAALGP